jgi:hypothetical protein
MLADFRGIGHSSLLWDMVQDPEPSFQLPSPRSNAQDALLLSDASIPEVLVGTTSGLGATSTITYQPLSVGGSLYAKDPAGAVAYPTISLQTAQPVVSEFRMSDVSIGVEFWL